jgi:hypothetical protein
MAGGLQDKQPVHLPSKGDVMSNDKSGRIAKRPTEIYLDFFGALSIQRIGWFVKNDNPMIVIESASNSYPLPLAAGKH